jgi:electron transfer flavoprotein alpha subunit
MSGNVWVLAEQWRGQLSEITFEVLALGREVATALGARLETVLLGHNARELAKPLGKADAVLYVDHPWLAEPNAEPHCQALTQLVKQRQPQVLLVPLTNVTMDLATLLAANLQVPFVNWCKDVRSAQGGLQATCVLYGGKMEAATLPVGQPAILAILPGARPADQGRADQPPTVEELAVTLADAPRVQFKRYIEPEAGDVDISQQGVLVSVGRGIQSQDNLQMAEELAQALGGAVCGSRPVIDQGWLPLSRQVGKSGVTVKPKLYLAVGISGAPEHVEGMRNSGLIIAINTDPQAPIFNVAHYGIVADAQDVLPALTKVALARKG